MSRSLRIRILLCSFAALSAVACEGEVGGGSEDGGGSAQGGDGQGAAGSGGSGTGATGTGASGTGATGTGASGTGGTGATGTGASGTGGGGTGAAGTGASGTGGGGNDPYAAARTACINKINELRATKGAPAYAQWTQAEQCADDQATSDEQSGNPHGAFGMCSESGQNECLGQGVAGIESCLQSMWNEKDQAGCAGCDACADAYNPNCPNCDFFGDDTGDVCGHYVNMRALYFSKAACGFSDLGGWDVIDFQ